MRSTLVTFVALVLLATTIATAKVQTYKTKEVIGLFCADDGTYSGLGELAIIKKSSTIVRNVTIPLCLSAEEGTYKSTVTGTVHSVLFVTTGINAVNAAACSAMATDPTNGYTFSKILWAGTSGWSPLLGGLEPTHASTGGCNAVDPSVSVSSVKRLSVGSVCITASNFDSTCGFCNQESKIPDTLCRRPNCEKQNATQMFGQCNFAGDASLSTEVLATARKMQYPTMPSSLQALMKKFWAANEYVNTEMRLPENTPVVPTILGPQECAEGSSNEIWVGANMDYLCREYTADLLKRTPGSTIKGPQDVTCVSAMEGPGFARVMTEKNIPYVIIRGASNYDQFPLYVKGQSASGVPQWGQNFTYVSDEDNAKAHIEGYHYAITTTNLILMQYLDTQ